MKLEQKIYQKRKIEQKVKLRKRNIRLTKKIASLIKKLD